MTTGIVAVGLLAAALLIYVMACGPTR